MHIKQLFLLIKGRNWIRINNDTRKDLNEDPESFNDYMNIRDKYWEHKRKAFNINPLDY